jgi:hypothetical protein
MGSNKTVIIARETVSITALQAAVTVLLRCPPLIS